MLRPQDTATRERKPLTGLWRFRLDRAGEGRSAEWFRHPLTDAREPDLTYARQWQERDAPNATWAERYGSGFDDAGAFLRDSEAAHAVTVARGTPGVETVVNRMAIGELETAFDENARRYEDGDPALAEGHWEGQQVGTGKRRQEPRPRWRPASAAGRR